MLPRHLQAAATAASRSGELAKKTAIVLIEFQNSFCTPGGLSHGAVKDELERTGAVANTVDLVARARRSGVEIIWAPITYNDDFSDLPQRDFGAMAGAEERGGFKRSEWDGAIIDELTPLEGETVLAKKTGLCAFAQESELEAVLREKGIENIAVGGLLTNCCVESTVRTAYEHAIGFKKVITLTECTATTDQASHEASLEKRKGRLNFFSNLMDNETFFTWLDRPMRGSSKPTGGLGITGLSHLNVIVPDVDAASSYYQELLGFEPAINDGGEMNYKTITGSRKHVKRADDCGGFFRDAGVSGDDVDDAVVDVVFLRHPTGIYLELMTYHSPAGKMIPGGATAQYAARGMTHDMGGIRHIALEVDDANAALAYLETFEEGEDYHLISNLEEEDWKGVERIDPFPYKFLYFVDRYGVQWELEQGRPVSGDAIAGIVG